MSTNIEKWEDRLPLCPSEEEIHQAKDAELADLRAALAAKTEGATLDAAEVIEALRDLVDLTTHQRDVVRDAIAALLATIDMEPPKRETIRKAIHYPECWDVTAYPTLAAALSEVYGYFKCQQCVPAVQQGGEAADDPSLWHCGDCDKHVKAPCEHRPCGYRAMQQQANSAAPHPVMDDKSGETVAQVSQVEIDRLQHEVVTLTDIFQKKNVRIDALEQDAARYRWLRNNSFEQWQHPIVVAQNRVLLPRDHIEYIGPLCDKSLDEAIDEAIAATKGAAKP